jgi:uroporphyrin-III C-methyltransferase/precorrin-2 dehydrogenase/sirohydrochlorin ferrochelatase
MARLARLPVFFGLEGKRVVVAGVSPAAAWKAELLLACGARVDVLGENPCEELVSLAQEPPGGEISLQRRAWTARDLEAAALAIGAFEEDSEAAEFANAARAAGVPVNVVDKPTFCNFSFGSIVNRSPLVIGISTDGGAPVLAQAIRAKLEALIPAGFAAWTDAARRWRNMVKASGLSFSGRRKFWQIFTAHALAHPGQSPAPADFDRFLATAAANSPANAAGSVTLVGAGPGDPELLTLRAVRAMQSADVILVDDLVAPGVLDFARREAKKMVVGKTGFGPSCKQEEINALIISLAQAGRRVVRLKGGDPLIFGRAGEEIEACRAAGIPVDVVPGISAAQGAAADLKIPLTHRKLARRVQFVTAHGSNGQLPPDIDWKSLGDASTTTAVYMPRRTLAALTRTALAHGAPPDIPAIAIVAATRPQQRAITATLADIGERVGRLPAQGPLLVLIGRALAQEGEIAPEMAADAS